MSVRDLRELLDRVVLAREALADGDVEFGVELLRDLELDIASALERLPEEPAA